MKLNKTILVAGAVVALSLPATVLAAKPAPKPANPNQATLVAKNSAWACKALRAQNAATFKTTFGTNASKSNAYGKCVSAHAKTNRSHKPFTVTFRNLAVASTGTVTA